MRNLKRALSLTLASVMLLGMMVFGTSAASFTDADQISNVTAATVLQELKVMQGSNGKFSPNQTVTRGQMAILICNILYGDKLNVTQFAGTSEFTDVPANAYYTGYVNLASQLGIISGYGNGKFGPGAPVTTAQAALMLTRALGYFQADELTGQSWSSNALAAIAQATKVGMFGKLKLNTNDPLSRDNVAEMVFNTMTKAVPVMYSERWGVYYTDSQSILDGVKFNYRNTLAYQNFDLVYSEDKVDDFERPATEWGTGVVLKVDDKGNIDSANIKVSFIKAMNDADATYTAAVKLGDIYKDLGLGTAIDPVDVDFYRNGKGEEVSTGKITANNKVGSENSKPNLDTLGLSKGEEHKIGGNGVLTQVWYNVDDKTAIVSMIDTYTGKINTVFKASGSTPRYVTLNTTSSFPSMTSDLNNKFETEAFEADELVMFTAAWNGRKYDIKTMDSLELAETAVLTKWEGSSVVNSDKGSSDSNFTTSKTYKYSENKLITDEDYNDLAANDGKGIAGFTVNESEVNVYLDKYGYAIHVSGVEGETNYAAVIGIGSSNTHGSETKGVTLLLPDGTQKAVTAKSDDWAAMTLIDQVAGNTDGTLYTKDDLKDMGNSPDENDKNLVDDGVADLVTYSIGSDGVYKLTLVGKKNIATDSTPYNAYSGKYDMTAVSNNTKTTFVNGKSEMKIESIYGGSATAGTPTAASRTYYTTSKTVFMVATQKKTTAGEEFNGRNYNVYVGYENAPSFITASNAIHGIAFALNKQYTGQIDVVYIDAVKVAGVSGADTYFLKDGSDIITTSDGKYYKLPAVVKGELTTIMIDAETVADWDGNGVVDNVTNDGYSLVDGKETLQGAAKGMYAIQNVTINKKGVIESCGLVAFASPNGFTATGTVKDRYDVLGIGTSLGGANYWSCASDVKVYYIDKDWEVRAVALSDIQTDSNDRVFAMYDDDTGREKKLTYVFVKEVEPGDDGGDDSGDGLEISDIGVYGDLSGLGIAYTGSKSAKEIGEAVRDYLEDVLKVKDIEEVTVSTNGEGARQITVKYAGGSSEIVPLEVEVAASKEEATAIKVMNRVQQAIESASSAADKPNPELVSVTVEGNTMTVTPANSDKNEEYYSEEPGSPATHDLARFLGKLYTSADAKQIKYTHTSDGEEETLTFAWKADNEISGNSKSKWYTTSGKTTVDGEEVDGQTLVGVIVADFKGQITDGGDSTPSFTITVDGCDMIIQMALAE